MEISKLIAHAIEMMKYSHAPYSGFRVGAALLCKDGSVYGGCNVEGSSYGSTICAERTALVKAVSEGEKDFAAIAVCSSSDDYCTPCGICRQMLADFGLDIDVYCCNQKGEYIKTTLHDLLPMAFTGDALK